MKMELSPMVSFNKEEIFTKLMAVVALATLIFVALSFTIVPNEGAESAFVLKLKADQPDKVGVTTSPGESTIINMELYSTLVDGFDHEISLMVSDINYFSSEAASWEFEFMNPDSTAGQYSVYEIGQDQTLPVALQVTFQGTNQGEIVVFTISGLEDNEKGYDNDTRLSPLGGEKTQSEYMTVYSAKDYLPFSEPADGMDPDPIFFLTDPTFSMTIWNLGSLTDDIYIAELNVYLDNGDGVFSPAAGRAGEDTKNDNVDVDLTYANGVPYHLDDPITLNTGVSEEIIGTIDPAKDNVLVPTGEYFIELVVDSASGDPYTVVLHGVMEQVETPDFSILDLEISESEVDEGDTVTFTATIKIDWDQAGEVEYAFYVDDDMIGTENGIATFTESDTSKRVSIDWKAEIGDEDSRTIKVVVDPDDKITEKNDVNNDKTAPLEVLEEDSAFPYWIIAVAIGAVVVVGGAYWFIVGGGAGGSIKIESIIIRPEPPQVNNQGEIVAVVKNDGSSFQQGDHRNIVISYYEDYESIGEKAIDLTTEDFESGATREVTLSWTPLSAGIHNLNVAVDIDDDESDVTSRDIEIIE